MPTDLDLPTAPDAVAREDLAEMREAVHTMVGSLHRDDDPRSPASDHDRRRRAWRSLAAEHSLLGLHQPPDAGGQGLSASYTALVAEAHGQHLVRSPFTASQVLAAPLLAACASAAQRQRLLEPLLDGRTTATLAGADRGLPGLGAPAPGLPPDLQRPVLTRTAAGPVLHGSVPFVCDAATADVLLVLADVAHEEGLAVVAVRPDAPGLDTTEQRTLDPTRPRGRLDLDGTPGEELDAVTTDGVRRALAEATVLVAAEAVGGARACLASTVGYVGLRHQFDRPIGSFQAVQHALADLHGEVEAARACVESAATLLDRVPVGASAGPLLELLEAASLAKAVAADAFVHVARETIHLHGGIGFTWEHDAHLYYKRALGDLSLLGHPAEHRRALVAAW